MIRVGRENQPFNLIHKTEIEYAYTQHTLWMLCFALRSMDDFSKEFEFEMRQQKTSSFIFLGLPKD